MHQLKWPLSLASPGICKTDLAHKDLNSLQGKIRWWCGFESRYSCPTSPLAFIWNRLTKQSFGIGSSICCLPGETVIIISLAGGDFENPHGEEFVVHILSLLLLGCVTLGRLLYLAVFQLQLQDGDNNCILLTGLLQNVILILS